MNIEKPNLSHDLISELVELIQENKQKLFVQVNSAMTLTYWQIGFKINHHVLGNERAEYGEALVKKISERLVQEFGITFKLRNIRRMIQFSNVFQNFRIVSTLLTQFSWSHFMQLILIKDEEKRNFYIKKISEEKWSVRETRRQIERKAYERSLIASEQTQEITAVQKEILSFKDPNFLDFLGLKEGYLEYDLESAILIELENFILEMGKGFAFIERQKRLIIHGEDFYLDLLFFHRKLKRLVANELKIGKFKAAEKGQMELYLNWLNEHKRTEDENPPIGLILCAEKSSEQIKLLSPWKDGIMIAEYWTELPPKPLLEKKLHEALITAKQRIEQRKLI
ncbi:MAG: PDDEXK nuclease domain-containing protein [Flavobacteriaceae bacterium]|nr:PDDEXK nuclease domain-containing protein [Flavobacteriaceae bacterium]